MSYAGFWKRLVAAIIDTIVILIVLLVISFGFLYILNIVDVSPNSTFDASLTFLGNVFFFLYYAVLESSSIQGTLGKMILRIKVTTLGGDRISFSKALGRNLGKCISSILFIGFLMVAFTKEKQGLHDKMAGCLVINR